VKALLHLEAWQAFECHSCGRCCRDSWHIHVEPQARPAILASQAARRCEKEGYLPLVVLPDQTALTGRREDGACVFLDGKNLCTIHGELGGSHKPLACQLYPYTLTATPDGYFASLSFACPSVVAGPAAAKLESNREELLALLAQRGRSGPLPERVELWPGQMLDWRQYRELEPALLAEFDASDPVTALLDLAVGLLRSPTRPARVRREEPFEESLLEMICASVIALWELPETPEQRQSFSQAVLLGEPLLSHRHGIPLPAFAWGPTPSPLMLSVFERYFRNAVEGKALLAGPLLHRLLALACGYALVLYYGEAFRQACGAGEWNLDLLSRAFALVEAELVTHTASADELFTVFGNSLRQAHESESY
jgi:Fe-S-cluster containining protein